MFGNFTANLAEYMHEHEYLLDTANTGKSNLEVLGQIAIGFVGEMYVLQIFLFLQMGKLSLNNVNWIVDMLGHFCSDGKPIDETRKFATWFCSSNFHGKIINFLAAAIKYHVGLLTELNEATVGLHNFLSVPEQYFERIQVIEQNYREKTDVSRQFRLT